MPLELPREKPTFQVAFYQDLAFGPSVRTFADIFQYLHLYFALEQTEQAGLEQPLLVSSKIF